MKRVRTSPFTLLEVILSVSIFAMVAMVAASGFFAVMKGWEKIKKHNAGMRSLLLVDRVVDNSFRNAVPFSWRDDNNKDRQIFLGDERKLTLAYIHRIGDASQGGIRFISLSLDGNRLVATYRKSPILHWKPDTGEASVETIADKVRRVSFLYAGKDKDKIVWFQDWDEENNPNIPLAIQMTIEWENGSSECWLRRTAGASLRETLGKRRDDVIQP